MIRDNNHLATALLVSMPLMNYLRLESRHAIIRYGFLAAMVLTLFAVVGSYSRGAILALAAVAGFFWLKSSNKLISGMFVVLALVVCHHFMPERWIDRMNTIQDYQSDGSAVARLEVWHVAWLIAVARPLVGGGFFATYSQPVVDQFLPGADARAVHSIWFEVLGGTWLPDVLRLGRHKHCRGDLCTQSHQTGNRSAGTGMVREPGKDGPGLHDCVSGRRQLSFTVLLGLLLYHLDSVTAVYQHVTATLGQSAPERRRAVSAVPARLALSR